MGFDFEIQFKPGTSNRVADALSRKTSDEIALQSMISTPVISWEVLKKELVKDKVIQQITAELTKRDSTHEGFSVVDNVLKYKGRTVLPRHSSLKQSLLHEYHDSVMGGHFGELKTYQRMATNWYWARMRGDITQYVRNCQQQKNSQLAPASLLQPLTIPNMIWEDISMDFVDGLPTSQGFNTVLVVVDRLSKYAHFIGLKHLFDAFTMASVFIKEVVRLHGFPTSIISDRDRIFLSTFWKEIFKLHGTTLKKSIAYHP